MKTSYNVFINISNISYIINKFIMYRIMYDVTYMKILKMQTTYNTSK